MKLTNPDAIKALKKVRCCELEDMLSDYPESDVDGRSDWEMIANEAGWLLSAFNEYETAHHEDLEEARHIINVYNACKRSGYAFKYKPHEIQTARDTINEYNRLTRFVAKLKSMGLYCPYC